MTKRILAIDGGGIKGVFPAAFLSRIEERLAHPIGQYFDLIAGTSTGGVIALGLGAGFRAVDILQFYKNHGPKIFPSSLLSGLRHYVIGKYSSEPLRRALVEQFQLRHLGESATRLIVPAQSLESGQVHIWKTAHHPRLSTDYRKTMVDVAMATCAAPTYFRPHRAFGNALLIDGGLWANNPVGIAAVEAIAVLGWSRDDVEVLSISCTGEPYSPGSAARWHLGKLSWAFRLLDITSAGQSSAAVGTAQLLLGREHVHRIEPVVANSTFKLDSVKAIERLEGLADVEARTQWPRLEPLFQQLAPTFEPCHVVT